jgi:hypothetical protein
MKKILGGLVLLATAGGIWLVLKNKNSLGSSASKFVAPIIEAPKPTVRKLEDGRTGFVGYAQPGSNVFIGIAPSGYYTDPAVKAAIDEEKRLNPNSLVRSL